MAGRRTYVVGHVELEVQYPGVLSDADQEGLRRRLAEWVREELEGAAVVIRLWHGGVREGEITGVREVDLGVVVPNETRNVDNFGPGEKNFLGSGNDCEVEQSGGIQGVFGSENA